jgi:hypothetical protein
MELIDEQLPNALLPTKFKVFPNVIEAMDEQPKKPLLPIVSTTGKFTDAKDEQLKKHSIPTFFTLVAATD